MPGALRKRGNVDTEIGTEGRRYENSQAEVSCLQVKDRGLEQTPALTVLGRNQPHRHTDLGLAASSTVRQSTFGF